jgi:L-threonylcarbamoyladenylate synthase
MWNVTGAASIRQTLRLAPDAAGIAEAARLLRAGGLVAFPTETVYGIGADATDPRAVAGIYAAKERPRFNPLIAHLPDLEAAERQGVFGPEARALAERFWPGPLTLVVPRAPTCDIADLAAAGLDSVALRVPAHPVARAILATVARPVAAPSANRSGRVSPTTADHVLGDLAGRIDAVVDGGATEVGLESTIVACLPDGPPRLLRPGGIPTDAIESVLGQRFLLEPPGHPRRAEGAARGSSLATPQTSGSPSRSAARTAGDDTEPAPLAPGMLISHYAPHAAVRLEARAIEPGEAVLAFGGVRPPGIGQARAVIDLSPSGDLAEAAATLFAALRALDETGATMIAVTPVPEQGLGEAINDRLRRAAAPRASGS